MNQKEKNALSRQRILSAAMEEFARKGYQGASLNAVCAEKGISKGNVYHYFKDKDELYLLCVGECFGALTAWLQDLVPSLSGSVQERLRKYFDARFRFFAAHPLCLGIFADAVPEPPPSLADQIAQLRRPFDDLNAAVLTELLRSGPMRPGLRVDEVVEDFRLYMDFFNLRFKASLRAGTSTEELLKKHEEQCHRQLDILLYGVMEVNDETKTV